MPPDSYQRTDAWLESYEQTLLAVDAANEGFINTKSDVRSLAEKIANVEEVVEALGCAGMDSSIVDSDLIAVRDNLKMMVG
jgi:DNA-binding Lrp family transcriptional regulator